VIVAGPEPTRSYIHAETGTLTPATKNGFLTIVFDDAGEFAELEWTSDGWIIIGLGGLTAQPVVTA